MVHRLGRPSLPDSAGTGFLAALDAFFAAIPVNFLAFESSLLVAFLALSFSLASAVALPGPGYFLASLTANYFCLLSFAMAVVFVEGGPNFGTAF